ncbi:hypothetical protein [Nocardia sp. NPDC050406]|uniref:hypothetical protein n=1 Tax=Nocardia sp. NPDC050406 TaxID=3364318 RepID=UPI0037B0D1E9
MQLGNTKHGPAHDDSLAHEVQETLRANRTDRVEEWRDPEAPAEEAAAEPEPERADADPERPPRPETRKEPPV